VVKFLCICGEVVQTSGPIPHPHEWLLIADEAFDEFDDGAIARDALYASMAHAFECFACRRL
jgi:hypothetical protein